MEAETMNAVGVSVPGSVEDRLNAVLRSMETLRHVVESKARELAGTVFEGQKPADIIALERDLAKTVMLMTELEGKVSDARCIERGGDGLDLEAARAEIGSRLDSILAARGEGTLS
ncbi:MAG: hypothetical protein WBA67_05255 [Jannaschia sp.]